MTFKQWAGFPYYPVVPWPGEVTINQRPDAGPACWCCMASWREYAAGGISRFAWLAPVKALWNVALYRLAPANRALWWH